jgi:hypothetical protein
MGPASRIAARVDLIAVMAAGDGVAVGESAARSLQRRANRWAVVDGNAVRMFASGPGPEDGLLASLRNRRLAGPSTHATIRACRSRSTRLSRRPCARRPTATAP